MALIGEDCHFYITTGCVRGNQCAFRHQPAARTTEASCPDWIQGNCLKANCGLRHVPVDRSGRHKKPICFYENQPSGCLKPNCQFLHTKRPVGSVPSNTTQAIISTTPAIQPTTVPIIQSLEQNGILTTTQSIPKKETITPKITPPAAPPPAPPTIVRPTVVNGVLHLAPSRGILGAPPPGIQVVPQPMLVSQNSTSIFQKPSGGILQAPLVVQQPNQPQPAIIRQQNAAYPKSEHFDEQVRLFKKMLSNKQMYSRKQTDAKNYHDDDENDSDGDYKHKEKQRSHRTKKPRKHSAKGKKKSKEGWMDKADEEMLYGDYKNVPIEKKHKQPRNKEERTATSDSDVNVKSYEEVLREKALRKLMEKRKEKFNDDFENMIQDNKTKKTRNKKYSSDGDETVDSKLKHRKSIDLSNEIFSQEDAVELQIEDDEFSTETEEEKQKRRKSTNDRKRRSANEHSTKRDAKRKPAAEKDKNLNTTKSVEKVIKEDKNKNVTKEEEGVEKEGEMEGVEEEDQEESTGIMVIPDETTDINFHVDDVDDLALELNQENKHGRTRRKHTTSNKHAKKIPSSIVSFASKSTDKQQKSEIKTSDSSSSSEKKPKRKIMVVDSPVDKKKSKEDTDIETTTVDKKKVISLSSRKQTNERNKKEQKKDKDENKPEVGIKIKTFEEIMEEKRLRKFKDVVVVSDSEATILSPIKTISEQSKTQVLLTSKSSQQKSVVHHSEPVKTAAQLKREKLRQAKEEYEKRRQSRQIYRPKALAEKDSYKLDTTQNAIDRNEEPKKITLSRKPSATTSSNEKVKVRSFQEIMNDKRSRREKPSQSARPPVRGKISSKPIESYLRRSSADNKDAKKSRITAVSSGRSNREAVLDTTNSNSSKDAITRSMERSGEVFDTSRKQDTKPINTTIISVTTTVPVKLKRLSSSDADIIDEKKTLDISVSQTDIISSNSENISQHSIEDIQEALNEKKRMREEDILSDDEFEKEMNDLLSSDDGNASDTAAEGDDVDDDDFMMELQQMIDS